eukprot:scaffold14.g1301.t1
MGNCCSTVPEQEQNNLRRKRTQRMGNWERTGVISARDARLKARCSCAALTREWPAIEALAPTARVVDVTNNSLTTLPPWLASFGNLQRLGLSRNGVAMLPPATLGALSSLRVLLLDSNAISDLPESIGQLAKLERLSLAGNVLVRLPTALGRCVSLKLLDVSKNRLTELPEALSGCTALEELDAHDNAIERIPESLGSLRRLKTFSLDGNRISAVPPPLLAGAAALQTLSLHDNPITPETLQARDGAVACARAPLLAPARPRPALVPAGRRSAPGCAARARLLRSEGAPPAPGACCSKAQVRRRSALAPPAQATEGYAAFEVRRRTKDSKGLASGVLLGRRALDEGVDRELTPRQRLLPA